MDEGTTAQGRWYYAADGKRVGPLQATQLGQLFRDGQITATTPVWRAGLADWMPAGSVPDLGLVLPPSSLPKTAEKNDLNRPAGSAPQAVGTSMVGHGQNRAGPGRFPTAKRWFGRRAARLAAMCFTPVVAAVGGRASPPHADSSRTDYLNGLAYATGHGVPQDYAKAMEWFRKAAAAGNDPAMDLIGALYQNGLGVPQDYTRAMAWYRKGAAAGNGEAMAGIGGLYATGYGVPQDFAKAMEWWRKAAATGNGDAMYNIGVLYEEGGGVPQDYAKAKEWFEKAAASGDPDAARALANLTAQGH